MLPLTVVVVLAVPTVPWPNRYDPAFMVRFPPADPPLRSSVPSFWTVIGPLTRAARVDHALGPAEVEVRGADRPAVEDHPGQAGAGYRADVQGRRAARPGEGDRADFQRVHLGDRRRLLGGDVRLVDRAGAGRAD